MPECSESEISERNLLNQKQTAPFSSAMVCISSLIVHSYSPQKWIGESAFHSWLSGSLGEKQGENKQYSLVN